jgi:cobalt/nickel transport system ATP-binding protein
MSRHVPGIQAEGISFSYQGRTRALEGLDFAAAPGEFAGLVGPNGSGKTTLLKVLLRLLAPQAGTVRLGGRDIREFRDADLYQQIGMVFQNPNDQLWAPTVEEDVAFGPRNLGLPAGEVQARVEEALAVTDAAHLARRPIHHLSFGEQKRVCVAGVLAMRPSVLLLDEPTSGLDPDCERHMVELLLRLNRRQGITIVLATHSVDLLPILATRLYVLSQGRVLKEGGLPEILGDPDLVARAGLRLPLVAQLFQALKTGDGLPVGRLPLTVGEARLQLMEMLSNGIKPALTEGRRP